MHSLEEIIAMNKVYDEMKEITAEQVKYLALKTENQRLKEQEAINEGNRLDFLKEIEAEREKYDANYTAMDKKIEFLQAENEELKKRFKAIKDAYQEQSIAAMLASVKKLILEEDGAILEHTEIQVGKFFEEDDK